MLTATAVQDGKEGIPEPASLQDVKMQTHKECRSFFPEAL